MEWLSSFILKCMDYFSGKSGKDGNKTKNSAPNRRSLPNNISNARLFICIFRVKMASVLL
jgi:hypothetical protein